MMKTSVRKIAAALTVAAISGSFSVYAEINEESTIQFSAYKVAAGTEDRVSAEFSTTFANVDLASGSWINNLLRGGTTGSYNGGTYLYSQGDNTAESITVTLSGVASGYYTLKQFDVAAASSALDITISSGNESYEYTTAPTQSGEFVELGTELLLGGEVTIVYRAASAAAIRLDETQLVMTEQTEPSVTDEPSATYSPSPTPDTSTPTHTIDPGDIPEDLSPSKVNDVQLTGQLVEADGLEGLAVDGTCEVTYKFESENGENDNGALIRWYRALTKDGEYTEIDGSTGSPYTIKEELGGYYVKAGVSVLTDKDTVTEEIFTDPIQVKYRLAFYDDFDYTATSGEDPAFIEHGWTSDKSIRVLGSPTVYCARVPENITVEDGLLMITTRKEHLDKYNELDYEGKPHTWTTGSIWTTEAYGPYGVYEASYKLTEATGLNQSFWSMVRQPSSAENGFIEMDFNEGHYPYEIATNLHRSTGSGTVTTQNSIKHYPLGNTEGSETLADNFNRYTGMLVENDWNYTWDSQQNSDTYKEIIDYVGSPTVIVIPSRIENVKVEGIAINTFKELTTLKELRIKKGLQNIGDWSFVGCTALESVQLPDSLVSINTSSFQGCESLTEITIPSSVKNIEDGAFSLCPKLEKVTFNGNAPEETGRFIFGDDNNVTVYFYKGAQGFTTPEWNGYSAVEMDGEPIPIPEPVLTSIELTGGRDSAVRGFTLTPFTARAYDDIGDEITDIDFVWSVTGNATVENGIVTIGENAKNGETVIVKAEGTYNGKTMSAKKTITIGDTLKFSFGNEYIKIKPFLPGSMAETAIADTGITTTVTVSQSTNYSNVEIMNRDTKAQSGYYPFKDGLPGDFYYLFISGEGKNELKLPYTVRAGETIRIKFAKPYATNNGTKNRSEVNNKLDLTIGSETYSLKDNCDFDTWYTKDFVVDADTNMMTISMGTWSAITIESIEILVNGSDEEPIETGFSSVEYHDGTAEVEFYAPGGVLLIAAYDTDGRLLKTALCQSSEWTKDGEIRRLPFHIRCFRQ